MTALGFHARRAAQPAPVPLRRDAPLVAADVRPALVPTAGGWIRVGQIRLRSAARYLLGWAGVLFGVLLFVLLSGYVVLSLLGVTSSVSQALAIVLDEPLPSSGVLPFLQPQRVLPLALLVALLLSLLAFAAAFAAVLIHNAVSELTGGLRVRIRPAGRVPQPR